MQQCGAGDQHYASILSNGFSMDIHSRDKKGFIESGSQLMNEARREGVNHCSQVRTLNKDDNGRRGGRHFFIHT